MKPRVVLVGCGNMGHAMLAGWLAQGRLQASEVAVVEPFEDSARRARELSVAVFPDVAELGEDAGPELIVLAIKPQSVAGVLPAYRGMAAAGAGFLSVLAGTTIAALRDVLGSETPVIRCMPNTPAAIGRGMLVTLAGPGVEKQMEDFVDELLTASGEVARVDSEELMDAVTAVSGSGPAYLFHFIECLARAGEKAGLPAATAMLLARQTAFGAASLVAESGEEPAELRRKVTSPNGTTEAALNVLMRPDGLERLMTEAVEAARTRSIELGRP